MSGYYIIPIPNDYLKLSGGTVTGGTLFSANLSANTVYLTNTPGNNNSSNFVLVYNNTTKAIEYRDASSIGVLGNFLPISGGTLTGQLNVPSVSGSSITGFTFYSGSTPLQNVFAYSGTNIGSGTTGIFAQKNNNLLEFKTLSGGTKITITGNSDTVIIQTSGVNSYYIQANAPSGTTYAPLYDGDRWFNTTDGIELVWIDDSNSTQWVEIITSITGSNVSSGTINYIPKFDSTTTVTDTSTPMVETGSGIVVGNTSIQPSAIFEINSTTLGFLPPRMTEAQLNGISSPAIGLIIYQTDGNEGLYVFKSDGWHLLG